MSFDKEKAVKAAEKYVQQGKVDAAIAEYRKIVDADPQDFLAINTLGDLYVRANQPKEAIKDFLRVAETYRETNQTVKAIAMYKKIHKIDPENIPTCLRLAELYAKQRLLVDARQLYQNVIEAYQRENRTKDVLKILHTLAELEPHNTSIRIDLAHGYQREGLTEEAFEAFLSAGQEFIRARHLNSGIEAVRLALNLKPESKQALEVMVEALAQQGGSGLQEALEMIGTSLGKHPKDKDLVVLLGHTYLNAGLLEQAEQTFNYLLEIDKTHCEYQLELAHKFLEGWNVERAIACMDRVLDQLLAQQLGKSATALLKEILIADPTNVLALRRLIYIYMHTHEERNLTATLKLFIQAALIQGLRSEAIWALSQLIELEPADDTKEQLDTLRETHTEIQDPEVVAHDPLLQTFHPLTSEPKSQPVEPVVEKKALKSQGTAILLEGMFNQRPDMMDAQVALLEELVKDYPDYIEARLKLRQVYHERGLRKLEAEQCQQLARLFEAQGDKDRAKEFMNMSYEIHLLIDDAPVPSLSFSPTGVAATSAAKVTATAPSSFVAGNLVAESDILKHLAENSYFDRVFRHVARTNRPISLLLVHIDGFTDYLTVNGQERTQQLVKQVHDALQEEMKRPIDELIAGNSEGFAVVLPETDHDGAMIVAERMREAVAQLALTNAQNGPLTVHIGMTTSVPERNSTSDYLMAAAEQARQKALSSGGNQVIVG